MAFDGGPQPRQVEQVAHAAMLSTAVRVSQDDKCQSETQHDVLFGEFQIEDMNKRYSVHVRSSRSVNELFISNGR